jgi:hypothetical protein
VNRFSNSELLKLPNCTELTETGRCKLFNTYVCKGDFCRFKKTFEDQKSIDNKTYQRLASLSELQQTYISNKYYSGKKPWTCKNKKLES